VFLAFSSTDPPEARESAQLLQSRTKTNVNYVTLTVLSAARAGFFSK
jgi:hypothetical protein